MSVSGLNAGLEAAETGVSINPVRLVNSARGIFSVLQRFSGATLVLAAFGLWAVPGASWAADLALVKLTFSLAMGFSGLALWQMGSTSERVEIELDTDTFEARIVVKVMGRSIRVLNCRFNELQRAEVRGDTLHLWDGQGRFLAEVDMCHPQVKKRLTVALQKTGLLDSQLGEGIVQAP